MVENTQLLQISPVIPVVTIDDPAHAVPIAQALLAGGIRIIELTLRTDSALRSLRRISDEVPDILVGAGTVLNPFQADAAVTAGAQFLVSPGTTTALLEHLITLPVPVLPGVATVSEALSVLEHGITAMKFFPAAQAGGLPMLAAMNAPIPQIRFCPTGGITAETAPDYLAAPNVACIGGSWLTPKMALQEQNWSHITGLASHATTLRPAIS
jgi:2-dehydro-3-deoxyphosphogluconate aldolase/(4S)-4-hydroxy-2-oxoglutarate aldolase